MFNFVNIVCQSWGEIHFVIGPPYQCQAFIYCMCTYFSMIHILGELALNQVA